MEKDIKEINDKVEILKKLQFEREELNNSYKGVRCECIFLEKQIFDLQHKIEELADVLSTKNDIKAAKIVLFIATVVEVLLMVKMLSPIFYGKYTMGIFAAFVGIPVVINTTSYLGLYHCPRKRVKNINFEKKSCELAEKAEERKDKVNQLSLCGKKKSNLEKQIDVKDKSINEYFNELVELVDNKPDDICKGVANQIFGDTLEEQPSIRTVDINSHVSKKKLSKIKVKVERGYCYGG